VIGETMYGWWSPSSALLIVWITHVQTQLDN
jgi:hypothetical protein